MGLWSWVGEASASRNRATEVAPTLAEKVECSFIYTKLDNNELSGVEINYPESLSFPYKFQSDLRAVKT